MSFADIKFYIESSIEKLSKPDKRLYRLVEDKIGAKGDEIFFIDDTLDYLESARDLGWQTFLYKIGNDNGITSNKKIKTHLI